MLMLWLQQPWIMALLLATCLLVPSVESTDFECSTNRPGWADHRTLYVPEWMLSDSATDTAWMEALCCVYTHVQITSSVSSEVPFEVYDGSEYIIQVESSSSRSDEIESSYFSQVAAKAMEDICDMSMGSDDCQNQAGCVEQALATAAPMATEAPTSAAETETNTEEEKRNVTALLEAMRKDALNCTTNRPNSWAEHRTLFLPESMIDLPNATATNVTISNYNSSTDLEDFRNELAWIEALCCVYTNIEIVPAPTTTSESIPARLELYDGYTYNIPGDTIIEVASNTMDDICDMSMGRRDCELQIECVNQAFLLEATHILNTTDSTDVPGGRRAELLYEADAESSSSNPSFQMRNMAASALLTIGMVFIFG